MKQGAKTFLNALCQVGRDAPSNFLLQLRVTFFARNAYKKSSINAYFCGIYNLAKYVYKLLPPGLVASK